jgi:hypothetical protein
MDWKNRYTAYFELCKKASEDDELFKDFKRHKDCTDMLEHVNYEHGLDYLEQIKQHFPYLMNDIGLFATNDDIGNPYTYYFKELGFELSPSVLRYVKVLGDLNNLCGDLDNIDIVEVGGGYGGQCKIIHDLFTPKSYTIIDAEEVLLLTGKYLREFKIKPILRDQAESKHYDLFISNYAFTEIDRKFQNLYAEKLINNSDKGYIICNWFGIRPDKGMTKEEISKLKPTGHFIPERPLTGTNNCIYIWQ